MDKSKLRELQKRIAKLGDSTVVSKCQKVIWQKQELYFPEGGNHALGTKSNIIS